MAKGKTQKYYDANPAANKRRIAQQKRYNKNGKGKHGLESPSANRARPRKKNKSKLYITK